MSLVTTWSPLTSREIQSVPEREGVYELADSSRSTIYIGRSNNLRERLSQHLNTTDPCLRSASYFRYEVTWRSEERERELLQEFRRRHGRLPRCNDVI